MLLSASYSTATAGFDTAVCDICATSSSEFEAPRDQLPELVVPSEAEEPRDVRSCERDTELPVADLVVWTVVIPVSDEASDVVAFILLKLKAAAAAPEEEAGIVSADIGDEEAEAAEAAALAETAGEWPVD